MPPSKGLAAAALAAALAVALLLLAAWLPRRARREGLAVSPEARRLTQAAAEVFAAAPPQYQEYRRHVAQAGLAPDPVQYTRLRALYRAGALTPPRVQAAM